MSDSPGVIALIVVASFGISALMQCAAFVVVGWSRQPSLRPWRKKRVALNPQAPSSPVSSTPGDEVTPSTASRGAQATAAVEGVSHFPS